VICHCENRPWFATDIKTPSGHSGVGFYYRSLSQTNQNLSKATRTSSHRRGEGVDSPSGFTHLTLLSRRNKPTAHGQREVSLCAAARRSTGGGSVDLRYSMKVQSVNPITEAASDPRHVQPCPRMSKVKTTPWTKIFPIPSCDFESYVQGVQGNRISLLILEAEINKTSLLKRVYIINRDSLGPRTGWTSTFHPSTVSRFFRVQHSPAAPDTPGHGWTCAFSGGVC